VGCVFAEDEAALLLGTGLRGADLEALVLRRVAGEPLETVLGWVSFAGRRLSVGRGVFVPRRRTELLARTAAAHCRPGSVLLELCCGVGPVAATVEASEVHLADIDPVALSFAAINVPHGHTHLSDLYGDLPVDLRGRIDVVAANAPYVPTDHIDLMPPEAREHEPQAALDGGPDGVDLHRRIAAGAPEWLAVGGVLMIETSTLQAALTEQAMHDAGLATRVLTDDDVGGCVVLGVRPGEQA
jgi:release factor glutamine methyltransferase